MSTQLTSSFTISSSANLITGYGNLQPAISKRKDFTQGVGTDAIDQVYFADLSVVASGTPKDLDLIGGGLVQPDGTAFAPVKICEMLIINLDAAATLTIGGGSNPWVSWLGGTTPTIKIPPGGDLHISAPVAGFLVTAATADILRIATDSATPTAFTIKLSGRSS